MKARVTAHWTGSIAEDVDHQLFRFAINGEVGEAVSLAPDVESYTLGYLLSEGDIVTATVSAVDGVGNAGNADFAPLVIPDLTAPAPPTGLGFTYEVVDDPVEPAPTETVPAEA